MIHGLDYAGNAVQEAREWAGRAEAELWELAIEHAQELTTWRLLGHAPDVAGRALVLRGAGASSWEALAEANRLLGRPLLD